MIGDSGYLADDPELLYACGFKLHSLSRKMFRGPDVVVTNSISEQPAPGTCLLHWRAVAASSPRRRRRHHRAVRTRAPATAHLLSAAAFERNHAGFSRSNHSST